MNDGQTARANVEKGRNDGNIRFASVSDETLKKTITWKRRIK